MTQDPGARIETIRADLESGDRDVSDDEADILLSFSDRLRLLASEYTDYRHKKLLRHAVRMAEHADADLTAVPHDREATETVVRWIHREYDNPETNRDYRTALRQYARHVTDGEEIPEAADWVSAALPNSYDPSPDPAAMLRWDGDVKPMIEAAANARDAALVATAFESGARSGELRTLSVGDISDGDMGIRVRVDGKTGERTVTLLEAEPYLSRWLGAHPASDDPDAPLWSKLSSADALSYRRFRDIFDDLAARADVEKPTAPTQFRKANASWLARQGANAALIEDRQGRTRNSEAVARYVSRFGEADEARQYASLQGIDVELTGDEELAPIECPRCGETSPHDEPMCVFCGKALDPVAAETADQVRASLREAMARSDDASERAALLDTLEELDSNPEAANDLVAAALERADHD